MQRIIPGSTFILATHFFERLVLDVKANMHNESNEVNSANNNESIDGIDRSFDKLQSIIDAIPEMSGTKLDAAMFKQVNDPFSCEGYVHNEVPSINFKQGSRLRTVTFNTMESKYAVDDVLRPTKTPEFREDWSNEHYILALELKKIASVVRKTVDKISRSHGSANISHDTIMDNKINDIVNVKDTGIVEDPPVALSTPADMAVEHFETEGKNKNMIMILIIVLVAIVLLGSAICIIYYSMKKSVTNSVLNTINSAAPTELRKLGKGPDMVTGMGFTGGVTSSHEIY
jgi:hypothetical protein